MEPKTVKDDGQDWVGKSPDELTAQWQDTKIEEVLDRLDDSRLDAGMNSAPDPP